MKIASMPVKVLFNACVRILSCSRFSQGSTVR